jgi:hypothetical protein
MDATDLVAINDITRVLLVYSCQQGVCPRGHVLPLRLPNDPSPLVKFVTACALSYIEYRATQATE